MNLKKIALTLVCGSVAVAAMGQGLTTRVFTYDGTNLTNGNVTYIDNGDGVNAQVWSGYNPGTVYGQNGIAGASVTNAQFLEQTLINVSTYVYISGNFGGVYNVQGVGSSTDINQTNDIEVRTNRTLSFTATGFYPIGVNIGQVAYGISLYQDFPSNGVQIGLSVTGTDAGFNGSTVYVNPGANLPADGRATLRLSRTLSLTQAAVGGKTYTVAGFIAVGVN